MPTTKPKRRAPKRGSAGKNRPTQADRADRHALYQRSVQDVESEIDFVDRTFLELRGRRAVTLREDFCGTANTSCEWVQRRDANRAVAVDIDPEVLAWGRANNVGALPAAAQERVTLLEGDVLVTDTEPVDALLAMNFSYWLFSSRPALLAYFRRAREAITADGIFFLDAYGGYDAPREIEETRECDGFEYVWDQEDFDPVNSLMRCSIHFKFSDQSELRRAFTYTWRLWTLPEIRELLEEAGFGRVRIFWEGADEDGEGNGEFTEVQRGEADAGWIAYIVAEQ